MSNRCNVGEVYINLNLARLTCVKYLARSLADLRSSVLSFARDAWYNFKVFNRLLKSNRTLNSQKVTLEAPVNFLPRLFQLCYQYYTRLNH